MVRVALLAGDGGAVDVYQLAYHAGVAFEVLAEILAIPLFYQRYPPFPPSGNSKFDWSTECRKVRRTIRAFSCCGVSIIAFSSFRLDCQCLHVW